MNNLAKFILGILATSTAIGFLSSPAQAQRFVFGPLDGFEDPLGRLQGSFSGNDLNNDNTIDISELNDWEVLSFGFSDPGFNGSLNSDTDFEFDFNFNLASQELESFVFADTALPPFGFSITLNDPFTAGSLGTVITIADGRTRNDPLWMRIRARQVPEPVSTLGAALAIGLGTFFKRKLKPSKSTEEDTTKIG